MKRSKAEEFYAESLKILNKGGVPFMIGGTYALIGYTGIKRPTKDVDIFCKAGDFPKIMKMFSDLGYKVQLTDERWLAKVIKGQNFFDIIFNSAMAISPVTDEWFKNSPKVKLFNIPVSLLPPTELIWSKAFVQARHKYDGADIAHVILKKHQDIDWKRLLAYMEQYWEVLLIHTLNFRFIYPSERELIPRWLLDELLGRLESQIELPTSKMKVCRGRLFSSVDYAIDVKEWGFEDLTGWANATFKK